MREPPIDPDYEKFLDGLILFIIISGTIMTGLCCWIVRHVTITWN